MPDTANAEAKPAAGDAALRVAGLDHVVLRVASLERALEFYGRVLGLYIERELDTPRLVQLRAGAAMIDLVPGERTSGAAAGNMDHFAVRLERFDPDALAAHLRQQGVEVGEVKSRYGAEGYGPSLYITDPDGNVVELKGPPEPGQQIR
jgi:catechol 2,3-dioxygenase-like lactoylglutathione lyase family enzyme